MSTDEQSGENNLKVMSRIEIKHKPSTFEDIKERNVRVKYLHAALDKCNKDLNDEFVPKLDSVLDNNQKSISKLHNDLDVEKGKTSHIMEVINHNVAVFHNMRDRLEKLELATFDDSGIDEGWRPPQFKSCENELFL
ncbi:hypothetical protein [Wolbachia endosymbiont (group B) of Sphaerophoria taeniata]|uniref:hypothetical protein n=1 Tax=Wolbachia endosymbiont (group B) of Sphaerophoria taeniata TaxID=2954058 RepID=UPI002220EC3B|nr:hypothetical protein [Wolbachia endosymbiont (group B) of Sphaerophoria taeniata]